MSQRVRQSAALIVTCSTMLSVTSTRQRAGVGQGQGQGQVDRGASQRVRLSAMAPSGLLLHDLYDKAREREREWVGQEVWAEVGCQVDRAVGQRFSAEAHVTCSRREPIPLGSFLSTTYFKQCSVTPCHTPLSVTS